MRAVLPSSEGPYLGEVATPEPKLDEVLVRVHASALNRADLAMLTGAAHGRVGGSGVPLGLEWAGEVVQTGSAVTRWKAGDRVMAAGGSAFAEYAVAGERRIYPVPENLPLETAATFPVALQTMYDAIASNGLLEAGQSVLIQGASSGVGLMGLQVAKFLGAGLVIGTSTSDQRRARLSEFGADLAIDTRAGDWVEQVKAATGGRGVDLIVDQVAGPLMNGNLAATRIGGRIVNVGRLGGMHGEFNFDLHALRRIHYVGVTFRTRNAAEVEDIMARTTEALLPAMAAGRLTLPIDRVFPLDQAPAALERMQQNAHFGKIVLTTGA